ncbi:MAG: hypothetical protein FWG44_05295 [Oscillospiraceae bacterium]|nr:hypothetical protein [Oscillospiraceae bacterium]
MGFFNKLAKTVVKEVVKTANQSTNNQNTTQNTSQVQPPPVTQNTTVNQTTPADTYQNQPVKKVFVDRHLNSANHIKAKAHFKEILTNEFSGYEIRENVPLSEFGGEGRPYDFGLFQDERLVSVIVLPGLNNTRNHPFWNSEKKAKELKIPFIKFYTHMPNEKDYVISRINKFMKKA